jgi:hypothetical protein
VVQSTTVRPIAKMNRMDMVVVYTPMVLITKENGIMVNVVEKVEWCIKIRTCILETF